MTRTRLQHGIHPGLQPFYALDYRQVYALDYSMFFAVEPTDRSLRQGAYAQESTSRPSSTNTVGYAQEHNLRSLRPGAFAQKPTNRIQENSWSKVPRGREAIPMEFWNYFETWYQLCQEFSPFIDNLIVNAVPWPHSGVQLLH